MRFLITGAAGFLGSALANRLVAEGHEVRGVDDLSAGDASNLVPEVNFVRGDVNDRPKLWTLLQDVDCVFHLAARVSVQESALYPREYEQVNVGGTVTLMEAMRDVGVHRVVLASSAAIYGDQPEQPLREEMTPNPSSPYAVSKLSAEYYVRTIGALAGIEAVCLRVFNAYGPGQHLPPAHAPVIPSFLRQAATNGTLVVHGDGSQTRDYVYVDDVIRAMTAAATARDVDRLVINVGSGRETSVRDLVRLVTDATGGHPEVVYNGAVDPGQQRMCADLKLASEKLGYTPTVTLETGLHLTLEHDARFKLSVG
jgi:UDP-glucose 4-epimerase